MLPVPRARLPDPAHGLRLCCQGGGAMLARTWTSAASAAAEASTSTKVPTANLVRKRSNRAGCRTGLPKHADRHGG